MKLTSGDAVVSALISRGQVEYLVTTDNAETLRFSDEALRAQGRVGQGVAAIALTSGARVVSASYLDGESQNTIQTPLSLFVLTEAGFAKKVPLSQYPQKGRATGGVVTTELLEKDRMLLTMIISEHDYLLITWNGDGNEQVKAIKTGELKAFPRAKKGVPLVTGHVLEIVKLGV